MKNQELENEHIIKEQFVALGKLALDIKKKDDIIADLKDSVNRRQDWLYKAKQQVNVDDGYSFDKIWNRVLEYYKSGIINFDNL